MSSPIYPLFLDDYSQAQVDESEVESTLNNVEEHLISNRKLEGKDLSVIVYIAGNYLNMAPPIQSKISSLKVNLEKKSGANYFQFLSHLFLQETLKVKETATKDFFPNEIFFDNDPMPKGSVETPVEMPPPPPSPVESPKKTSKNPKSHPSYSGLQKQQRELICSYGNALYVSYLPFILPWARDRIFEFFEDPEFCNLVFNWLKSVLPEKKSLQNYQEKPTHLLNAYLNRQLETLIMLLGDICNDKNLREDLLKLFKKRSFLGSHFEKLPEGYQEIIDCLIRDYLPDSFLSLAVHLRKLLKENDKLRLQAVDLLDGLINGDPHDQMLVLFHTLVELKLKEPLKKGIDTLIQRLCDPNVNPSLLKALKEPLLTLFFPTPQDAPEYIKNLILSMLESITFFVEALNVGKNWSNKKSLEAKRKNVELTDKEKIQFIINSLHQTLLDKKILPADLTLEKGLENQIQDLLSIKMGKMSRVFSRFIIKILNHLTSPFTINQLILHFIEYPMQFYNPVLENQGPPENYSGNDPQFTASLERGILKLRESLLTYFSAYYQVTPVKWLIDKVLDYVLPINGVYSLQLINRFFHSKCSLFPVLIPSQILFLFPPIKEEDKTATKVFARYVKGLNSPKRTFLVDPPPDEKALKKLTDAMILGNDQQTEKIRNLLNHLPIPTFIVLNEIRTFYTLIKYPELNFLQLLQAYLVHGLNKGLKFI